MKKQGYIIIIIILLLLAALLCLVIGLITFLPIHSNEVEIDIMGCTSKQWNEPNGGPEVFTDQQISPDKEWICVATSPEGPFNWERYQVEEPKTEEPVVTKQVNGETDPSSFQKAPDNCQESSDWSMDTKWTLNAAGVPGHDLSPVGSLESTQWLLFETHRDSSSGEVLETFVGAIPPGQVMWLSGHAGGTGWYICISSMEELQDRLNQHADNLLRRDGIEQTIVVLPEDISLMDSILVELQTEPVKQ